MNLKQLLAGFEAAVPAVGEIVTAMHPEDALEGAKIAAVVQLFQIVTVGLHQIAKASAATPAASAAATASAPTPAAAPAAAAPDAQPSAIGAVVQLQ